MSVPMTSMYISHGGTLMKKRKLWYGFLEAGVKSSPVVIDRNMITGEKNTIFVYNHNKQEINKYVRDLVEPKLRELSAKEKELQTSLDKGFKASLKTIKYKVPKTYDNPVKGKANAKAVTTVEEPELEYSESGDDDWDDSND